MDEELWRDIPEFPNYMISNYGRVYSKGRNRVINVSYTHSGHAKISLMNDRYTRSIALLVAEAFVEPPNALCDHVVLLDGNPANVAAENLVWRPRWYGWKYSHQMRTEQPMHYQNVPVINTNTGEKYQCIIDAGITEGLLFDDIWRSTHTSAAIFPNDSIFEIV